MYGPSSSMTEFCKKAQMVNYDCYRAMFEAWNSHLWQSTSGLLLWMTHPAWPSLEWQTYSWDFETHGSYFGSRKACEPLHVQRNPHDGKVIAVNISSDDTGPLRVVATRYTLSGKQLARQEARLKSLPANSISEAFTLERYDGKACIIERLELYAGNRRLSLNDYLTTASGRFHELNLTPPATLKARTRKSVDGRISVEVENPSKSTAVSVKFNIRRQDNGQAVLPAYISDGYIHLLPSEKRLITIDCASLDGTALYAEGYNVARQQLITF